MGIITILLFNAGYLGDTFYVPFWVVLSVGMGLLSATGHCMVANWSFTPVCGFDFWRVIVTSPEVLIFLFFMITDPKTVPTGQVGRVRVEQVAAHLHRFRPLDREQLKTLLRRHLDLRA